jgi:hypothetical protein
MLLMVVKNALAEFHRTPPVGVLLPSIPSEGERCGWELRQFRSDFGSVLGRPFAGRVLSSWHTDVPSFSQRIMTRLLHMTALTHLPLLVIDIHEEKLARGPIRPLPHGHPASPPSL